jgi:hypothetical protein
MVAVLIIAFAGRPANIASVKSSPDYAFRTFKNEIANSQITIIIIKVCPGDARKRGLLYKAAVRIYINGKIIFRAEDASF